MKNIDLPLLARKFSLRRALAVKPAFSATKRAFAIIITALLGLSASPLPAQVITVLHNFANSDGRAPAAGLTASGNTLFGTTQYGGDANGYGVVFSLNTNGGGFQVLHNFAIADGGVMIADLSLAGNTLYGAASQEGANFDGTLFSLAPDGTSFTANYNFSGAPDGEAPKGGLLPAGNMLYGTASSGTGVRSNGVVFAIGTTGMNFATLHNFGGADGQSPEGDLVLGDNVLYGTTYSGGASGLGAIYSVETNGLNFTLLHSFSSEDGAFPTTAGLVLSGGILYGTAFAGGSNGNGTVFSVSTNGSNFTVLHSFEAFTGDGAQPQAALYLSGNILYGTTSAGGAFGPGTVFSINTDGSNYRQLFSFPTGDADGASPEAPVILLGNTLYGTTARGGTEDYGTVFALQISGLAFTVVPVGLTNAPVGSDVVFTGAGVSLSFPGAAIQYQWRLNGVNIPGATGETLSYEDLQLTNGGSLTMIISDGIEAATSVPVGFSLNIATDASNNDDFANAFVLGQAASGVARSSNTNATVEPGEPEIIIGNPGGKSIWFQWQPTNSGTAVLTTQGSDFDTMMGVYTGTNVSDLTRVPSVVNDDDAGGYLTSKVTFDCSAGTNYEISVDGYWGASGDVVLNWATENFQQPLPAFLRVPPRQTITSNGATVTLVCQSDQGVPTWFFNGQPTGVTATNFVISAAGDTNVGTYVAQVTAGGAVASTEPAHVQINALEDGNSDTNSTAWNKFLDSANSPYTNPAPASLRKLDGGGDTAGYSVAQTFSTIGAEGEPGDPSISGQIGGSPMWYSYVTPTNGAMLIDAAGGDFNTMLGVFIATENSITALTSVGESYTTDRLHNGQPRIYIPAVSKGQNYHIEVDGYMGASGNVHLRVSIGNPVVISTPPQGQIVDAGSNATFSVGATGSTPLGYLWQFNGTNIPGATTSTLTISNVQSTNTGTYTVVATNLVSAASNSATLLLVATPAISVQPVNQTVAPGATATLTVTASGEPPPAYQWMFDGGDVGTNGSVLSIPNFQASNQGTYFVVVSNSAGVVPSSNALVYLNTFELGAPYYNGTNFQLQLTGPAGGNFILQASTDLVTWIPLFTNDATNGFLFLTDTNAPNYSSRFYRGVTN